MIKNNVVCSALLLFLGMSAFSLCEPITMQVSAQQHTAMKVVIAPIGQSKHYDELVPLLQKALEFKGQFQLHVTPVPAMLTRQQVLQLWQEGYPFVIFLEMHGPSTLNWRLYDTQHAVMLKGKKVHNTSQVSRALAYLVADSVWQELTGEPGFFSTKIAYCKEVTQSKKRYKHIFVADYDGSNEQLLVDSPTITMAPRWNKDAHRPLLFYSENTNANVRMMATTMKKNRIMASNYDGLNMLPTFSADGKTVIYCASRGGGNCQLYHWHNKVIKKITDNEANSIAPTLCEDGRTLYYSSDFQTGSPQIYKYDLQTQQLDCLTNGGYCVSPSYCQRTGLLAYAKMVGGVMQLFVYDSRTQQHTQLTTDSAQKEECSWSPCGTYLLCPVEGNKASRIALFNRITKQYTYLTNASDRCSYPTWSGVYAEYPVVI